MVVGSIPTWPTNLRNPHVFHRKLLSEPQQKVTFRSPLHLTLSCVAVDLALHLLRRFTYGSTIELLAEVRATGAGAWFEQQLDHLALPDVECDAILASHPSFGWGQLRDIREVTSVRQALAAPTPPPLSVFQAAKRNVNYVRRMTSTRQVFETMVEFWSDHFNINDAVSKGGGLLNAYGLDWEVSVVRAGALSSFGSLLRSVVYHPAMIVWLDGEYSQKSKPNENFARELLELYTVTPSGGYTQTDIEQAAKLFSGLRGPVQGQALTDRSTISTMYRVNDQTFIDTRQQNYGTFRVMQWSATATQPAEIVKAIDSLVAYLAAHPSTARSVATKLARRFVADQPSEALVSHLASEFTASSGDIRQVLRRLTAHQEFYASVGRKTKRPTEDVISLTRALKMTPDPTRFNVAGRADNLASVNWGFDSLHFRLGHQHTRWPLPDGYPDTDDYWNDSASHVARWYAHQVLVGTSANSLAGVSGAKWSELLPASATISAAAIVDALTARLYQDTIPPASRQAVIEAVSQGRPTVTSANRDTTCNLAAFLLVSLPEWVQR
ncbi:MAG: DUF1800 domain-containing protein [Actinobacteria bacterium]|nr:DUF1800 domain-containing protein [Actinomycetota bacterium]NBP17951.1 DUF1800 domain-containing protein [Actinomycetota bacterium]NBR75936.1 DUF1800 domain-containing protein [Actinomycetota bacterium]NBR92057.1 DUF1800 domain-containing protein [Actinomycetota bacterium]